MSTAAIAIVVPCCNAAATLAATLDSALTQSVAADVIVVDDGSTDTSLAIARNFEPAVRVVSGPNRGASHARNTGIAHTSADWIVFLDADDLLCPGTLALRLTTARASRADVVICDWEDMTDDGQGHVAPGPRRSIDWRAFARDPQLAIAAGAWATTAAIIYNRAIVDRIGGFRPDLPVIQDARFLFDAARHGARFAASPHVGARYRIAPGSLSRRDPSRFWQDVLANGRQIEALWRAAGELDAHRQQAVSGIYDTAARGLFRAGDPGYFDAVDGQRRLGLPLPRHSTFAAPLARLLGLRTARSVLALVSRA